MWPGGGAGCLACALQPIHTRMLVTLWSNVTRARWHSFTESHARHHATSYLQMTILCGAVPADSSVLLCLCSREKPHVASSGEKLSETLWFMTWEKTQHIYFKSWPWACSFFFVICTTTVVAFLQWSPRVSGVSALTHKDTYSFARFSRSVAAEKDAVLHKCDPGLNIVLGCCVLLVQGWRDVQRAGQKDGK